MGHIKSLSGFVKYRNIGYGAKRGVLLREVSLLVRLHCITYTVRLNLSIL